MQKRFSILAGDVDHVAFADGALWVASTPSGELRKIDPRTNEVVLRRELQSDLCCVAAGGGYVWAASNPEGVVWKLTTSGRVLPTIELHAPIESLSYGDGALWAALGDRGKVVRVDPTTDAIHEYELGHSVTSVDADNGLIAAGVRQSVRDVTAGLSGRVAWVGRKGPKLFDSGAPVEPAFAGPTWDAWQRMFHYATCARLLNYPDQEGDAGRTLVPDVAKALPEVSDGGRTYTFAIRKGFRFSPPSNEEVTAESFRHAVERSVELHEALRRPAFPSPGQRRRRAAVLRRRDCPHLRRRGSRRRARASVPEAGAGPALAHRRVFMRRPGRHSGRRGRPREARPFRRTVLPGDAHGRGRRAEAKPPLRRIPSAAPGRDRRRVRRRSGRGLDANRVPAHSTTSSSRRTQRSCRARRRRARLALATGSPRTSESSTSPSAPGGRSSRTPGCVAPSSTHSTVRRWPTRTRAAGSPRRACSPLESTGTKGRSLYPARGDLRTARRLAAGTKGTAVVYTWVDPGYTEAFNRELRRQLAAIGIGTRFVAIDQAKGYEPAKGDRADLIWGGLSVNSADPGAYLQQLSLLSSYSDEIRRIATLRSPERERASTALARAIERDSLLAVYMQTAIPELVSRRLGCIVHQPEYAGVDLAALCLKS